MKIEIIQHIEEDGPGELIPILERNDLSYRLERVEQLTEYVHPSDGLIILGGSFSANEEFPRKTILLERIDKAIADGKPVLGICLGAQLLAKRLGAKVYDLAEREVGWYAVRGAPSKYLSEDLYCFHFHSQQFDVPKGFEPLGSSEACANQGFFGNGIVALQFHPEKTPNCIEGMKTLFPSVESYNKSVQVAESTYLPMHQFLENTIKMLFHED